MWIVLDCLREIKRLHGRRQGRKCQNELVVTVHASPKAVELLELDESNQILGAMENEIG
jgi:hypothetical protein